MAKPRLQFFALSDPLKFILMDIPDPFLQTVNRNQPVMTMTDRFPKLTRAILTAQSTTMQSAIIVVDYWVMPYGVLPYALIDNRPQFVRKFFKKLWLALGLERLTTMVYYPQGNVQVERYNQTILARIRHLVLEHQWRWILYV